MSLRFSQSFPFLGGSSTHETKKVEATKEHESPSLKLEADKEIYRPGDFVTVSIQICTPECPLRKGFDGNISPFLVDNLSFEIKGIEKLDTQWFAMQKQLPGSKLKKGERFFLESMTTSLVSKIIISAGHCKTYQVRVELPKILPPSYRGTTVRYIYFVRSTLCGRWLVPENGHHKKETICNPIQVEDRVPLQVWVIQKGDNLLGKDGTNDDIFSVPPAQVDLYWREKIADSEWVRANDIPDGIEDGYDSSRDEISSVSSYNPSRGVDMGFRNSFSIPSISQRHSMSEARYSQGELSIIPSYPLLSQLSVAEVTDEPNGGALSPQKWQSSCTHAVVSPDYPKTLSYAPFSGDDIGGHSSQGFSEHTTSEGIIRGRSYNIRIDDQVLLRFSPRNSDSTYYFGDTIGGTLTFFHEEGARRCLEVSVTLEISETIGQRFVHPSRRSSPSITKVQSDYHEVVADLVQTSFLFSIPTDGPMSFSIPYVNVQWALRFEFFTTPKNVDWTRYEHPLLVERREKGDWVLPITVSAPPPRSQASQAKNEKLFNLGNLSIQT